MKKNVILSAVAATVVTGVLMVSGCSSSSAPTKSIPNDSDVPGSTVEVLPANGKLTFSGTNKNDSAGDVSFTGTDAKAKDGRDCTVDPCEVTIKKACGKEAGKVLNYTNSCAVKTAYDALDATGPAAAADKEFRYAGFVDISSDDIESCKVTFSADLKCSLDRDGSVATNTGATGSTGAGSAGEKAAGAGEALYVYVNPYTAPAGSKVAIYVVPADGCSTNGTGHWVEGVVAYRANGTAYVQTEVAIDDIPARVYFLVEEYSQVDANDAATGSTGSSN